MMDAKAIIPTGWHFVSHFCEPDGITKISPLERRSYPVRYYFVGFGSAYHVPHQKQPLVRDIGGGDGDVPELLHGKPYDPFKLDVYTLGNIFKKELHEVRLLRIHLYLCSAVFYFPSRNIMVSTLFWIFFSTCMSRSSLYVQTLKTFCVNGTVYDGD